MTIGDTPGSHEVRAEIGIEPTPIARNETQFSRGIRENQIVIRWIRVEQAETE